MDKDEHVPSQQESRIFRCNFFSLLFHASFLVILYILTMPASGTPEADVMEIGFETSEQPGKEFASQPQPEENIPQPQQEEVQPQSDPIDLQELAEEYQKISDLDEEAAKEYQQKRQKLLEAKKRQQQAAQENLQNLTQNLKKRSRYGSLRPKTFYGVRIFARSMIFILDVSGSMDIGEAKLQLHNAYKSLSSRESFNIILYANDAWSWKPQVVPANEQNKQEANEWLASITKGGGTNIYDALRLAFEIARRQKVETMYFLSDGLPTAGRFAGSRQILQSVTNWNQSEITIHAIGIGSHQDRLFLRQLAEANHGRYFIR